MKYFEYIRTVISYDTVWAMGNPRIQIFAWAIGMIAPAMFGAGLAFGVNKTELVMAAITTVIAAALFVLWLIELDYWMLAPPPSDCTKEACDNDGEIRMLFASGVILLPLTTPSIVLGPLVFFLALRRTLTKHKAVELRVWYEKQCPFSSTKTPKSSAKASPASCQCLKAILKLHLFTHILCVIMCRRKKWETSHLLLMTRS